MASRKEGEQRRQPEARGNDAVWDRAAAEYAGWRVVEKLPSASRPRSGRNVGDLRIRQCFLEAIETGRLEALPAPVYALGFVRSYAEQLGLDPEEIASRFKKEIADYSATPLHFPLPIRKAARRRGRPASRRDNRNRRVCRLVFTSSPRVDMAHVVAPVPDRLERMLDHRDAPEPANSSRPQAADRVLSIADPERETQIMPPAASDAPSPTLDAPVLTSPPLAATPSASPSANVVHQQEAVPSSEHRAGWRAHRRPPGKPGARPWLLSHQARPPVRLRRPEGLS